MKPGRFSKAFGRGVQAVYGTGSVGGYPIPHDVDSHQGFTRIRECAYCGRFMEPEDTYSSTPDASRLREVKRSEHRARSDAIDVKQVRRGGDLASATRGRLEAESLELRALGTTSRAPAAMQRSNIATRRSTPSRIVDNPVRVSHFDAVESIVSDGALAQEEKARSVVDVTSLVAVGDQW